MNQIIQPSSLVFFQPDWCDNSKMNLPITRSVRCSKLMRIGSTGSVRFVSKIRMQMEAARLSTFQNWEPNWIGAPTAADFASAGFVCKTKTIVSILFLFFYFIFCVFPEIRSRCDGPHPMFHLLFSLDGLGSWTQPVDRASAPQRRLRISS